MRLPFEIDPEETLSKGINLVYRAGLQPHKWPDVVNFVEREIGGARVGLQGYDRSTKQVFMYSSSLYDESYMETYVKYYSTINPWMDCHFQMRPGIACIPEAFIPQREILKTEFYTDWLRPQENLLSGAGILLNKDEQRFFSISTNFSADYQEKIQSPACQLLQYLSPHLIRAFALQREMHLQGAELLLDALQTRNKRAGLWIVTAERQMLRLNRNAEKMLDAGGVVHSTQGQLRLIDQKADAELEKLLQTRLSSWASVSSRFTANAKDGDVSWIVTVYPIESEPDWLRERKWPKALVIVDSLATSDDEVSETLSRLFGLTPAENRVAQSLLAGNTVIETASKHSVSVRTVRNQLGAIFHKTGTRTQAELIRLLMGTAR